MKTNNKQTVERVVGTAEQQGLQAINQKIRAVKTGFAKTTAAVQDACLSIARHVHQYKDATPAARLIDAMPETARRALVIQYFGKWTPIRIRKDTKTGQMRADLKGTIKGEDGENVPTPWDIDGMAATTWDTIVGRDRNEPGVPLTFEEVDDSIVQFAERLARRMQKNVHKEDVAAITKKVDALKKLAVEGDPRGEGLLMQRGGAGRKDAEIAALKAEIAELRKAKTKPDTGQTGERQANAA